MPRVPALRPGVNPKDLLGRKKPPLALVPPALLILVSTVMKLGAKKYGSFNWRQKAVLRTIYLEAAMRHILSALDGEDADLETGVPHEASAAACMGIVLDAMVTGNLVDDRPTVGAAGDLIAILTDVEKSDGTLTFTSALRSMMEKKQAKRAVKSRRVNGKKKRRGRK